VDIYRCAKFNCNSFTGSLPPNRWNITILWLFVVLSRPVLVMLFFSGSRPGSGCVQGCPARNAYRAGTGSIHIPQVVRFYFARKAENTMSCIPDRKIRHFWTVWRVSRWLHEADTADILWYMALFGMCSPA